jgi:hypothetical protein
MGGKRCEGLLVVLLRRGGLLQTRAVGTQDGQAFAPDVRPERRDLTLGIQASSIVLRTAWTSGLWGLISTL